MATSSVCHGDTVPEPVGRLGDVVTLDTYPGAGTSGPAGRALVSAEPSRIRSSTRFMRSEGITTHPRTMLAFPAASARFVSAMGQMTRASADLERAMVKVSQALARKP